MIHSDSRGARLYLDFAIASDQGLVRGNNEDSAYAGPRLLALADGMGGHAAGEVASQIMITHLKSLDTDIGDNDMLALLAGAADDANAAIAAEAASRPETQGMGTTLTALLFNGHTFGLCHVGDSRGYRLREGELERITVDDTYVQTLVEQGKLKPEDVSTHPKRSLILKAYTGISVEPTLKIIDARPGDRLLLCSDGLSDPVTDATIAEHLRAGSPQQAADQLIALALRSGGPDNITVVVADVTAERPADASDAAVTGGALAGKQGELRPDTAAGRAAALHQGPASISPTGESAPQRPLSEAEERGHSGWAWAAVIICLVLMLGALGGAFWLRSYASDRYFLTVDDEDGIVVNNGLDYSVLGRPLSSPFQVACLDDDAAVRLTHAGDPDCNRFRVSDLTPPARSSVTAAGTVSYEEINLHLRRLAEETLPRCVTLEPEPNEHEAATHDLVKPGVNCREVRT